MASEEDGNTAGTGKRFGYKPTLLNAGPGVFFSSPMAI